MKAYDDLLNNMQLTTEPLNRIDKIKINMIKSIVSTILYIASTLYIISAFQIENISILTILISVVLIAPLFLIASRKVQSIAILIYLLLFVVLFLIQYNFLLNGFLLTVNQIVETIGIHTGRILPKYKITIEEYHYTLAKNMFWFILLLISAFFSYFIVFYRKIYLLFVIILLFTVFHIYSDISATFTHEFIIFLSVLFIIIYSFIYNRNSKHLFVSKNNKVYVMIVLMITTVAISFFGILNFIEPISTYNKGDMVSTVERQTVDKINQLRYEKERTNTYTQGDFTKLNKLQLHDIPALEVIMEKPTSLYLKGFIGSNYTGERWLELDPKLYYDFNGLFYWLNESNFNVHNQLNELYNVTNKTGEKEDIIRITVNNVNANSKYIYYPYELRTNLTEIDGVNVYADSKVIGKSFFGERNYKYEIIPNLTIRYPEMANNLYELESNKEVSDYLKYESHYNEFVYEHYTELPDYIRLLMENHLELNTNGEDSRVGYEVAIYEVRSYLYKKIKYNMNAKGIPKNKDFLIHFLEESKEGYAAHYASAATMMFRYLGIPSRYVEGYIVTPDDVKNNQPYEKITITGENAHAWTEIYIDRIGWIPIEVTPPYYDVMGKIDLTNYPEGDESSSKDSLTNELTDSSQGRQQVYEDDQHNRNDIKPEEKTKNIFEFLLIALLVLILLILLIYTVYIVRKRGELKNIRDSFNHSDFKVAVPKMFSYTMKLIHYDGIPNQKGTVLSYVPLLTKYESEEYSKQFEQAIKINQKALFSNEKINDEEFKVVKNFMDETLIKITKSKNIFQKIKMKYYHFII